MTSLVIVESPAKCSKIQGFLGAGWRVVATFGHIRALVEDIDAVGIERDFEPKFEFLKDKAKHIDALKSAAKGAKTIYLASDDDREGEAIAYSTALLLGLNPSTCPRAVFHEITASAVKKAVAEPRRIDMNRVEAQQARSVLDLMVGFTISPILWNHIGPSLSAGRCQTPALRILVDRERQITNFKSSTVWKVKGTWSSSDGDNDFQFPANLKDELEDQESALNFMENIHNDVTGTVLSVVMKSWTEAPPKPLITSTLQQEASALYMSGPKRTMIVAQKLYEAGHITYMRTDHAILSEEAKTEAIAMVKKMVGDAYVGVIGDKKKTNTKANDGTVAAQEAHEAIRPTHFDLVDLPVEEAWDPLDQKIYKLIWNRAVQSVMAAARGDERIITFIADGDTGEFPWESRWKRTTFLGWRKIGTAVAQLDETEAAAEADSATALWIQAMSITEGQKIKWRKLEALPQVSSASPRYNEATLVRDLEKKGIGRPSTYASLVETIITKKYAEKRNKPAVPMTFSQFILQGVGQWPPKEEKVTKAGTAEKDKMVPTPLGISILDFCVREFPNLFDYDFTAQMETRLDRVAQGSEAWKQVCKDTWSSYKDKYEALKAVKGSGGGASSKSREFRDGYKAIMSKKGPLLLKEDTNDPKKTVFFGWPEGVSFQDLTEDAALQFIQNGSASGVNWGTHDGKPLVEKKGPFGRYIQCGTLSVNLLDGDTPDSVKAKLSEKQNAALHTLGEFEFRKGQYGPFMFKKTSGGKKPVFVSLPQDLDPKTLTLEAAKRIYENGVTQKKQGGGGFRGGGRGGSRGGRGGSRGGRGGAAAAAK